MTKFVVIFLSLLIYTNFVLTQHLKCERAPEGTVLHKSPSDGRFRIRIEGNPEGYIAGGTYTIHLAGIRSMRIVYKFIGFFLIVEKSSLEAHEAYQPELSTSGVFTLYNDKLSKFSERCPNAVTQTSAIMKGEVKVNWTAPAAGSGCVTFRATIVEHRDVWYMDDEYLTKVFCEDEQDTVDKQPQINHPCCACEEAKYELTFERIWSRHTHPKDFPSDSLSTRFSDIIGASHTVSYRFWEYGKRASAGLKQVAERGSTRELESELKEESDNIRTIIKARGVTQPNITGKTFAVFRVDATRHIVSLVSAIDPSPDWIVGIAGLELCLVNCSWIETKKLNLYPWDAGTDSGATYISPDQPTSPPDVIRRIKPNFPNDPHSPFYDATGSEMKPLARITITRQRLYERNCNNPHDGGEEDRNMLKACETTSWSEWSECSSKCAAGKRRRNRSYIDPTQANLVGCNKKLTEKQSCHGDEHYCHDQIHPQYNYFDTANYDPECKLTEWGPWSSCSNDCGPGHRVRIRTYRNRNAKRCRAGTVNLPLLEETDPCMGDMCIGNMSPVTNIQQNTTKTCKTTNWSEWSPCSKTCGLGEQIRTRVLRRHFHESNRSPTEDCTKIILKENVVCGFSQPICASNQPNMNQVPAFCFLEPQHGNCRNTVNQFFYEPTENQCRIFPYTGCGGNGNRFKSDDECQKVCGRTFITPTYSRSHN